MSGKLSNSTFLMVGIVFLFLVGLSAFSFAYFFAFPPGTLNELTRDAEILQSKCDGLQPDARYQCLDDLIKIKRAIINLEPEPELKQELEYELKQLELIKDSILPKTLKSI